MPSREQTDFVVTRLVTLVTLVLLPPSTASSCTTAVVSGSVTQDGRPLLWKNRDFWQRRNEILRDNTGSLPFVGVANAEARERIRMGMNTAGFCIENSVSRDLDENLGPGPNNGELIRLALQTCQTVDDFRLLLEQTNAGGRRSYGNFGVIDAKGGAVMFEVAPRTFRAFDANDPAVAPHGFVVRSNFSELAQERRQSKVAHESLYSIERYDRAHELCLAGVEANQLDLRYMLQLVARDVEGCAVCRGLQPGEDPTNRSITTRTTLNRNNTVAATVFHGVGQDESPELTTMWTMLGEPLFTVAVPTWAKQSEVSALVNGDGESALCRLSGMIAAASYDERRKDLNVNAIVDLVPELRRVEDQLLSTIEMRRGAWNRRAPSADELSTLHETAATAAFKALSEQPLLAMRETADRNPSEPTSTGIDFGFDDADGTRLASTRNSVSEASWDGGFTDSVVHSGTYRVRRNLSKTATRYVELSPRIRVKMASDKAPYVRRGWLVVKIKGWNLRGETTNEFVRFGFTSQTDKAYHTAAMSLERTEGDDVLLKGVAFGDGSTSISASKRLSTKQSKPITLVLELDKVEGNPDEGDTGGVYRIFYREQGDQAFTQLGTGGMARRLRNGNAIHMRLAGFFAAREEFLDIDRIYFTETDPIGRSVKRVYPGVK